jgi:hypothetical protein
MVDSKLHWGIQGRRAAAKATNWILMFHRLTQPSTGVSARLMQQLYLTIAIPMMTYRLDVWYTPPWLAIGKTRRKGSVGALCKLEKVQQIAALAINRALHSTASDTLDVHANLMPVDLMLEKVCHRGLVYVCTLPDTHPLHELVRDYSDNPAHAQPTPLHNLIKIFNVVPQG